MKEKVNKFGDSLVQQIPKAQSYLGMKLSEYVVLPEQANLHHNIIIYSFGINDLNSGYV